MNTPHWCHALCIIGSLLAFTACSRTAPIDEARSQNILLVSNGPEPSSLDPHLCSGKAEGLIIAALWEPLTAWNEAGTEIIPAAAASWDISADRLTYTFHLRPDTKWSNGDLLTAHDWVRSFQRWLTPNLGANLGYLADSIVGVKDYRTGKNPDPAAMGFRAIDDDTFEIELSHPKASFLIDISFFPWLPIHLPSLEAAGDPTSPNTDFIRPGILVTNGPFILTDWKFDQFVEVKRNPHFRETAPLQGIRFMAMDNAVTQERAYRNGQLHVTKSIPASKIAGYQESSNPALVTYQIAGTDFLWLNTQKPPFDDVRVRQAFSLALDRKQLMKAVMLDSSSSAYSFASAVPGGYQPKNILSESAELARERLAAAGYPGGEGLPSIELLYTSGDNNQLQAMQQMWQTNLGVRVELLNQEWKVFLDSVANLHYQIASGGWAPLSAEPSDMLNLLESDATSNYSGWADPAYDTLVQKVARTQDADARNEPYHQMDAIIRDQIPLIPVSYLTTDRLIHPTVEGWPANLVEGMVWTRVGFTD